MIIKAKYPKIGSEDYSYGVQGFGSLYGGNQVSVVDKVYDGSFSSAFSSSFDNDSSPRVIEVSHNSVVG